MRGGNSVNLHYADRLSHHLSVGEKKRIAIATVLSMWLSPLVLYELSAELNPRARKTLIHLLHDMSITMLVSTLDMALVKELFPRTIVMSEKALMVPWNLRGFLAS
jgi:cobalt/nickel transport system ATP-binding protein